MKWLRRLRGAIGMGITWAIAWAIFGIFIGVTSKILTWLPWHYFFDVFDAPLPALAVPGFVGGVLFSVVLGVAGRRRRFDELSVPGFAAWGALGGLMLSLLPIGMVSVGLASAGPGLGQVTAMISVPFMLLSAASASGSLVIARRAMDPTLLESSDDVAKLARER